MTTVIESLIEFVKKDKHLEEYFCRLKPKERDTLNANLTRFLSTTMDQVRASVGVECTKAILKIIDLDDLEMLREGVWKREATGQISFLGQRDHTAHTLNNWMLGWYIYANSSLIKKAFQKCIRARGWEKRKGFSVDVYFGHIWQFASLLHDIGYLFEGSVSVMDPGFQSPQPTIGLNILDEYFRVFLWDTLDMRSAQERKSLGDGKTEKKLPDIPNVPSLSRIALYLRNLGDLKELTKQLDMKIGAPAWRAKLDAILPGDAFDLWHLHFKRFGQSKAASRILKLEAAFSHHARIGMPGLGIRILDHAVCSGLIQLKIATFFYEMMATIDNAKDGSTPRNKGLASSADDRVQKREKELQYPYEYEFWWTGIVWATASAAIHNIQQREGMWYENVDPGPMSLEEDPLGYLGILVDCLQEWDRYFVFDSLNRSPVQGIDVKLDRISNGIVISLPRDKQKQAVRMRQDLDNALVGWERVISLRPKPSKRH